MEIYNEILTDLLADENEEPKTLTISEVSFSCSSYTLKCRELYQLQLDTCNSAALVDFIRKFLLTCSQRAEVFKSENHKVNY